MEWFSSFFLEPPWCRRYKRLHWVKLFSDLASLAYFSRQHYCSRGAFRLVSGSPRLKMTCRELGLLDLDSGPLLTWSRTVWFNLSGSLSLSMAARWSGLFIWVWLLTSKAVQNRRKGRQSKVNNATAKMFYARLGLANKLCYRDWSSSTPIVR